MAVRCAKCGEELLGAVNRCWKCGTEVLSTPDAGTTPPIRRAPVVDNVKSARCAGNEDQQGIVTARLAPSSAEDLANDGKQKTASKPATATTDGKVASDLQTETPPAFESSDSPSDTPDPNLFAASSGASQLAAIEPPVNASNRLYAWLAIKSVGLGLGAIGFGLFSGWAMLAAVPGIVCGMLGVQSRRRLTAIFGLLLCLLGLTVSSVRLAYDTFLFIRGEPAVPFEAEPEDDFLFGPADSADPLE